MCGRFVLDSSLNELIEAFVVTHNRLPDWMSRWNISPGSKIPIVIEREGEGRELGPATWSLVPSWSKEPTLKYPTFNARSETAAEKPTFRDSVKKHRCLIPMSGYYEWSVLEGVKTPHFIHDPGQPLLAAAGLYSWWSDRATGATHPTATMLTRDSEANLRTIHDRMPVFVEPEDFSAWLDPTNTDGPGLIEKVSASTTTRAASFEYYPVRPLKGDGAHLIEKAES